MKNIYSFSMILVTLNYANLIEKKKEIITENASKLQH